MKRKTKIMISALSAMLVMVLAVTVVSFSFAGRNDKPEIDDSYLLAATSSDAKMTIVDRIIENSIEGEQPDYIIAEVGSTGSPGFVTLPDGSKGSFLQYLAYMDEDGISSFKTNVIDGNKTISDLMAAGKVKYTYYDVSSVTADDIAAIADSDLVYISNDPNNMFTAGVNDISEDLYSALLHTYTNNKKRPLIIDSPIETQKIAGNSSSSITMSKLAADIYDVKGSRYYTFSWNTTKNATDAAGAANFLQHKNGSLYLGINGNNKQSNWTSIKFDSDDKEYKLAKVLVVSASKDADYTNNPMTAALFNDLGTAVTAKDASDADHSVYKLYSTNSEGNKVDTLMYASGYNSRYSAKPDAVEFDEITLADIDADVANFSFDKYDMVVLEAGLSSTVISADLYKKLSAAMLGNITIVYDSKMNAGKTSGGGDDEEFDPTASKYNMLFSMVANSSGVSKKANVMVTNYDDFGVIAQSNSPLTCKKIADLLNASAFRAYGGQNASSSVYTVLEIQPCYPIDLEVAANNPVPQDDVLAGKTSALGITGNYYSVPAEVANSTKEQVSTLVTKADGTTSISTPEYYAWELSEAKIADALGKSASEVKVVHMSTEELAASTTSILGTYDMVYIGGNRSALKDATQWQVINGVLGAGGAEAHQKLLAIKDGDIKYLPIYTMYTHNGDMQDISVAYVGESGSSVKGGTAFASVEIGGSKKGSFGVLNGNDITYNKRIQLETYIEAGMPVIVSDDVATAYDALLKAEKNEGNKYLQNSLDPDCNMTNLIKTCYENKDSDSVLWDFDKDATYHVDNNGGALGNTNVGYVEVFAPENPTAAGAVNIDDPDKAVDPGMKEKIADLYSTSNKRPVLEVSKTPQRYDDTDPDGTSIDGSDLTFEYTISGGSDYEVTFWIDDDGNGRFGDETDVKDESFSTTGGTHTLADSFYGPLLWKLEVRDKTTDVKASIEGLSYVKPKAVAEKQTVKVLQIMPGKVTQWGNETLLGQGPEQANSLYFCVVCQQAYKILKDNPYADNPSEFAYYYHGNYGVKKWDGTQWEIGGVKLGKHEHIFGIPYYDSQKSIEAYTEIGTADWRKNNPGCEDWHVNLADEISDRFDFQLDILRRDEVEAISDEVREAYDFEALGKGKNDIKAFEDIVDLESKEFADYNKLTTDDEKLTYITQYNCENIATEYWNLYTYMRDENSGTSSGDESEAYQYIDPVTGTTVTLPKKTDINKTTKDRKDDLDAVLTEMSANLKAAGGAKNNKIAEEIDYIMKTERYYDFGNITDGSGFLTRYDNSISTTYAPTYCKNGITVYNFLDDYLRAKDIELDYLENYKKYDRMAHADNWIKGCYSTVIIGPSDDFAADDFTAGSNGLKDLTNYVAKGGNTLLFHDTFTVFSDAGSVNLTAALRPYVGQDKNHMTATDTSNYYVKYESTDTDKYFMTNLSYKQDDSKYANLFGDLNAYMKMGTPEKYLTSVAYTDSVYAANKSSAPYGTAHKYSVFSWTYAAFYNYYAYKDARLQNQQGYGTDRASKNNDGLVTLYPFTLSEDIYISGTHPQAYALDLEDNGCTVWYSLAGGYNQPKGSSLYAASPRDGQDSYFIYSYKNVYYCGAGHSKVTGVGKMNNDERKLYINIICNSVKKSAAQPTLHVYDYGKDTYGDKIKRQDGSYYTKVNDMESYPEFSFKATTDSDKTLSQVRIYYDLDYSDTNKVNTYKPDENHILIVDWNASKVSSGVRKDVYRYDPTLEVLKDEHGNSVTEVDAEGNSKVASKLKLQPEYFEPYNNEYTYIVIDAVDSEGNHVYQRIKVMLKDVLFNLT